ncbi:tRNA pseudouridine synthase [Dendrothele bispora CBS 962.96]|uniref:tRNA pseudouridine synthase n=1 Tax=Dendrothele bispora (strain CBS 962.96) TaxID=1314807 RepID=A0A4S8MKC9_DENBC|nr:tRNA pseudouridine synthase [Dendrothele bispora CBS 962.96]
MTTSYENWSKEELIARLNLLESQNRARSPNNPPSSKPPKRTYSPLRNPPKREFHFGSYARRKIALKFCYSGWEYNGLAFQSAPTPLPTVESVLFDALVKARLIDPAAGPEGCDWEKCGRTDRGVSAAGQVISLWVRSAKEDRISGLEEDRKTGTDPGSEGLKQVSLSEEEDSSVVEPLDDGFGSLDIDDSEDNLVPRPPSPKGPRPELDYVSILNRILPETIRVLAWSPVAPTFSARFACKYRHYKYFFSSDHLDLTKMQDAASRLLGEHDFRNLCKLDPGKQITIFTRKVLHAEIVPVEDSPGTHVLNLIGTAFLYHQVRHIMAILFLVGRGHEQPAVVNSLLNVSEGLEQPREGEAIEVVSSKPEYQMADALPLMLWDCGYSEQDVHWLTDGYEPLDGKPAKPIEDGRGIYHLLYSIHARSQVFSALNLHFLKAAAAYFPAPWATTSDGTLGVRVGGGVTAEVPLGGGTSRKLSQYVPVLQRKRLDPVELANERWRNGKGFRREQRKAAAGVGYEEDDGGDE